MDNSVEYEIRKMITEMKSGYNDGYVQDYYRKQLQEIQKFLNEALDEK
jgi:hypothetical protein